MPIPDENTSNITCILKYGEHQIFSMWPLIVTNDKPYLVLNIANDKWNIELDPNLIQKWPKGSPVGYQYREMITFQIGNQDSATK